MFLFLVCCLSLYHLPFLFRIPKYLSFFLFPTFVINISLLYSPFRYAFPLPISAVCGCFNYFHNSKSSPPIPFSLSFLFPFLSLSSLLALSFSSPHGASSSHPLYLPHKPHIPSHVIAGPHSHTRTSSFRLPDHRISNASGVCVRVCVYVPVCMCVYEQTCSFLGVCVYLCGPVCICVFFVVCLFSFVLSQICAFGCVSVCPCVSVCIIVCSVSIRLRASARVFRCVFA